MSSPLSRYRDNLIPSNNGEVVQSTATTAQEIDINYILDSIEFNNEREVEKPKPIISISDQTLLTAGNICCLTGSSKSGKSGILSAIQGGAMKMQGDVQFDTCGLTIEPNTEGKLLLHVDTEQSEYDY